MHECILVGFLAEVEVRRDRMLEQMNQEISGKNQNRSALASQRQAGREKSPRSRSPA